MKQAKHSVLLTSLLLLSGCPTDCGGDAPAVPPSVRIVSPESGEEVPEDLVVRVALTAFTPSRSSTAADAGSVELYLDRACPPAGAKVTDEFPRVRLADGSRELALKLAPGPHRLCAGLADRADVALASRSEVSFTVSTARLRRVRIVSPRDGDEFYSGESFYFSAENLQIVPRSMMQAADDAYLTLSIDVACPTAGTRVDEVDNLTRLEDGALSKGLFFSRGNHSVCLGAVDKEGRAIEARDQLTIHVYGP